MATKEGHPMEHKKEEAMKMFEQAERLFKADDLRGASTLARRARGLFPSLPGLSCALVAYHVHVAAREKKLPSGETDWHYVLGVAPSSAPEVIKKQYNIMRLLTHPDKNQCAAAEGAFKLVEQAWSCINSSFPPTSDSTTCPEPQNMTSRLRSQPPLARPGYARPKPAIKNSDGNLVCPCCQEKFSCEIAVDRPVLCQCQSCHGFAMITPENKFTGSSICGQIENGSAPRHERTYPPPPRPGTAQATSFIQHSSSPSGIPNFLLCPFCGTRNNYTVIDGLCRVSCKQCGVPSAIRMDGASSNKSDQPGGALLRSLPTGIAMCRKCHTPYDGEIPNGRRILWRCKLCGSWASIKLEIRQMGVHDDQQGTPAAEPDYSCGSKSW